MKVPVSTPLPWPATPETAITAEAGISLDPQADLRVESLVAKGDRVALGMPILRDRRRPEYVVTAPMAGRIAEIEIGTGRRLSSLVIHREEAAGAYEYDTRAARAETQAGGSAELRAILQSCGIWMRLRARPFGRAPLPDASPKAILVTAVDTRPLAPDPRIALSDGDSIERLSIGLRVLQQIADGPVYLLQDSGPELVATDGGIRVIRTGALHPDGLPGIQILRRLPESLHDSVWEIAAEDVAGIGELLATGRLPTTRLVSVAGPGLRRTRLVRCQPGADLRELCYASMSPGPRTILSGSVLDGREARWLGWRDRQMTVLKRPGTTARRHWLHSALRGAAPAEPIIATAAVEQAMGGGMPGMALLRALSVGDDEAAAELGALSLLEEDMALVDYVTAASPRFANLLRASLDRVEANA